MPTKVFESGRFAGLSVRDAFAAAAIRESQVIVDVGSVSWPPNLAPTPAPLGTYQPGELSDGPLQAHPRQDVDITTKGDVVGARA